MGPIALFDKSFLQSLSVDESVWFAHFFYPVVAPLFYVETLADLEKAVRAGRTPEQEVGIIADKFPDLSGTPCMHHGSLAFGNLLGQPVPMDGTVPRAGGREVVVEGRRGINYDESPEAQAFARWQRGRFLDIERGVAQVWRSLLAKIDLKRIASTVRASGIDVKTCKSFDAARALTETFVSGAVDPYLRFGLIFEVLQVPPHARKHIIGLWERNGRPQIAQYAPYAAHVMRVEIFFAIALGSQLIAAERPSNRVDINYLCYLPFCHVFISNDRLHRNCAPLFIRENQVFVWGEDLKADLARVNAHFMELPEAEKERGIMAFANRPPQRDDSIVCQLRSRFMGADYDKRPAITPPADSEANKKLVEHLKKFAKAPRAKTPSSGEVEVMSIQRMVRPRKGSWWQVPKDLKPVSEEGDKP